MTEPAQSPSIVKIPPPVWALAMLVVAYALSRAFAWASVIYVQSTGLAVLLGLSGFASSYWAMRTFSAAGTEIMPSSPSNKMLVTGGPFRFSRNPMYSGLVTATLGVALYFGTLPFFAVPVLLFLLVNFVFVPFEEEKMQRQFGNRFAEYRARVRRWL
jgi:protein-S-isoprenylcysteine O-methyltransferase Ste14